MYSCVYFAHGWILFPILVPARVCATTGDPDSWKFGTLENVQSVGITFQVLQRR